VTAPTNIVGTASSSILQSYLLEYRLKPAEDNSPSQPMAEGQGEDWSVLAQSTHSVLSNTLAQFDPTLLLNGIYELRLTATDLANRAVTTDPVTVIVDRNLKIGQFTLSFSDLKIPVAGIPIEIVRTYDSRNNATNDFGLGWSLDVRNVRLQKTRNLGVNWQSTPSSGWYSLDPVKPRQVTITLSDNKVYHFESALTPAQQWGYPIESVRMTFTNQPGTYGSLVIDGDDEAAVDAYTGYVDLVDFVNFSFFNPTRFRFTNEVGDTYIIDELAGLQQMADRNGNTLLISSSGVLWTNVTTGGPAVGITFLRDAQGRITNIIDPAGLSLTYTYGANGSLATFTDRLTNTTSFAYTNTAFPHYLTGITDPRGVQSIRAEFDDTGRLVRQIDSSGNVVSFNHDLSNNREIVTDRLGHITVHEYDDHGNVVRTTDALGNVTSSKYDEVDNLLEQVDALGNTNRYTYDGQGNKLTETDPLGNTTRYTCGPYRAITSITNPRGFTTTNIYDPDTGNLTQEIDPLGSSTSYSYDLSGNLLARTDALGNAMTNAYDRAGRMTYTAVIDAGGQPLTATAFSYDVNGNQTNKTTWRTTPQGRQTLVTTLVYDQENRLIQTIHPDGSSNTTVYALGLDKTAAEIDPLGRQTRHFYNDRGNLTNTVFPDLTAESFVFDAENRKLSTTDRAGRTTFYTNDGLGRLTATQQPDGSATNTAYDAIGRIAAITDERGNTTSFMYDPNCGCSGRQAYITNALGQVTHRSYDQNANEVSVTDALGHTITSVYDALDRRAQVIFPDGTFTLTSYDALGRRIAETDQNTNTTWFGYDALGRLVAVTNAMGSVTIYAYDEAGGLVRQTDAEGRTTTFEYDSMGRRIKRTLPLDQVESCQYDLTGNLTNRVDFNGRSTTYSYDAANRLLSKTPDPTFSAPPVAFTYTPSGQRASMNDASGAATYLYNSRDWLTNKTVRWTLPGGAQYATSLSYGYDPHGNLTGIQSSTRNGAAVGYEYDALNRLSTINDAHLGCRAAYTYDAVGNLQTQTYPNGINSAYYYDSIYRLTNLTTLNAQSSLLAKYDYTVAPAGQRLTAAENVVTANGVRTINRIYNYDPIYRLTGESLAISGPVELPANASVSYTHDRVGNRLSRLSTLGQLPSATYGYDANDRLAGDAYDNNGNTVAGHVTPSAPVGTDSYDFEDHLIQRQTTLNSQPTTIVLTYDGDGNRVGEIVNGSTTLYLVDDRNATGYAQVLEELAAAGDTTPVLARLYTYGHAIISQTSFDGVAWRPSFYGQDGHGNVRYLTDASGALTDTYDYDAFGDLIAQTGATPNSYLYCAEQFDADLGLYFNRARYLNTDSGRFWTMDKVEGFLGDVASLHKYLYAKGDPVGMSDASGLSPLAAEVEGQELSAEVDKSVKNATAKVGRRFIKKVACDIVPGQVASGVYILFVTEIGGGGGYYYVGQSGAIAARYAKWLSKLAKSEQTARLVKIIEVVGGDRYRAKKMVRELVEMVLMQELSDNGVPLPENANLPIDPDEVGSRVNDPEKEMADYVKKLFKKFFPGICD
jgi:RHS repeat-associated protein